MWGRLLTVVALCSALAAGSCQTPAEAPPPAPVGVEGSLVLIDLYGRAIRPLELATSGLVVFLFTRTDCPISNRYAPEIQRIMREYGPHADFWLVYPDPEEVPEQIVEHVKSYGYDCRVARDVAHELVDRVGAEVTPEVAVFNAMGRVVYAGRIDDRYVDFGRTRREATIHDLERVLLALLAGDEVASTRTSAVGCPIPNLP
jgi:peptidoglycan/xylan/chitin deacetylase (PgdA/CDA1 family)